MIVNLIFNRLRNIPPTPERAQEIPGSLLAGERHPGTKQDWQDRQACRQRPRTGRTGQEYSIGDPGDERIRRTQEDLFLPKIKNMTVTQFEITIK